MKKEKELFSNVFYAHDDWFKVVGATVFNREEQINACDALIKSVENYKEYLKEKG